MNVKKSIRIIEKFLRRNVKYSFDESRNAFTMHVDFSPKVGTLSIAFVVEEEIVNLVATFPFRGTEATAAKLAELVCRINCHLSIGHFDYDFDDGDVRYCQDILADQLKAEKGDVLARFFAVLAAAGEKFAPCIARVALGIDEPDNVYKLAVEGIERNTSGSDGVKVVAAEAAAKVAQQTVASMKKDDRPKIHQEISDAKDDAKPPVPVKNYTLEGLHVEGDFPIAKVESAAQKFLSVLKDGADALPDRPGFNILLMGATWHRQDHERTLLSQKP